MISFRLDVRISISIRLFWIQSESVSFPEFPEIPNLILFHANGKMPDVCTIRTSASIKPTVSEKARIREKFLGRFD